MKTLQAMCTLAMSLGTAVLFVSGCSSSEAPENISVEASPLTATGSGSAYATQCNLNHVPLPPDWGTSTIGPGRAWTDNGFYNDGFNGDSPAEVYYHQDTTFTSPGICVLTAHYGDTFSVICQGTNGKACFWEGLNDPFPSATPVVIATAIPDATMVTSRCTDCHAGQNAFITHKVTNATHPLNLNGVLPGWMTTVQYDPIVPADWIQNFGSSTTGYPSSCTSCHQLGGAGGTFPTLATRHLHDNYCLILADVVNRPSSLGGMPPAIGECTPGVNCALQTDPAVRAMVAACGNPVTPVPTNVPGTNWPGYNNLATRSHQSASVSGMHQHYFYSGMETMPNAVCCTPYQNGHYSLVPNDSIDVWVYLFPDDMPREIMIQVYDGNTWHRATWGEDLINFGPRSFIGSLPPAGSWQLLEFTPNQIGITSYDTVLSGMAFTLYDGSANWADVSFKSSATPYDNQYISQVWVGDGVPSGAIVTGDNEDWSWYPDDGGLDNLKGYAAMSSTLGGAGAGRGQDFGYDGNFWDGSVFHTNAGTNSSAHFVPGTGGEYWFTDLGQTRSVRKVILYNRTDCCMDRLSHFRINYYDPVSLSWRIASDQSNTITGTWNPNIEMDFSNINTRYIMVQKADFNYLHLAEVDVYVDP